MAFTRFLLPLAVLLAAVAPAASANSGFQVSYAEFFSGIGSIYNQTTQQVGQLSNRPCPESFQSSQWR